MFESLCILTNDLIKPSYFLNWLFLWNLLDYWQHFHIFEQSILSLENLWIISLSIVIIQQVISMSKKLYKVNHKRNNDPKLDWIVVIDPIEVQDQSRYEEENANVFDE